MARVAWFSLAKIAAWETAAELIILVAMTQITVVLGVSLALDTALSFLMMAPAETV
jgi:Tfp pilus assembly protein PilO